MNKSITECQQQWKEISVCYKGKQASGFLFQYNAQGESFIIIRNE